MKMIAKSLILGIIVIGIGFDSMESKNGILLVAQGESQKKVGGQCVYSEHPGVAVVLKIRKTLRSEKQSKTFGGPGYEGFEVHFIFIPQQEIEEEWINKSIIGEHLFRLANGWYPGRRYLQKYKIEVGSSFQCTLKAIKSGTCTPILFEFMYPKQNDYFETFSW